MFWHILPKSRLMEIFPKLDIFGIFRPNLDFWHILAKSRLLNILPKLGIFGIFRPNLDFWHILAKSRLLAHSAQILTIATNRRTMKA